MLRFLFFILLFFPVYSQAYQPHLVDFVGYEDNFYISDPHQSQAFYGELNGFPHTYDLVLLSQQKVRLEMLVPDIGNEIDNKNLIVVKKIPSGGVSEVSRINAGESSWEVFKEPLGNDLYRRGGSFEGDLEAGSYIVEVSTGDNTGKYVLSLGDFKSLQGKSFFTVYRDVYDVKKFFNKSGFAVFQSPYYYVPTLLFVALMVIWYWRKRRKNV